MHILFITDNFPPEVNAPASRTYEHCSEWVKAGHRVTVITGAPNFPKGKIFPGYRNRIWQTELVSGIRVIRVWTYIAANEGVIKRTLDYLSFMLSSCVAALLVRRVDLVVGTSPQFFTVCAACTIGKLKRVPWVFELRDMWPDSIKAVGYLEKSHTLNVLEKMELFLYRNATLIIALTHSFKASLAERGISSEKIHVVTNGVDTGRFYPRKKDQELQNQLGLQDKFVAGYIGTHGLAHDLDTVLNGAKLLNRLPGGTRFHIIFLGDGAAKNSLQRRARIEGIQNIVFVDTVSKEQVVRYWTLLDAAIIHLKNDPLFKTVIPSKLFECMGMGIPVLHGVKGESADIVDREGVGIVFEPENPENFVSSLRRLADNPDLLAKLKCNGPVAAQRYDRSVLAIQMLRLLENLADKK